MIPILLDDSKNLTNLASDNSNGLGKLSEVIDATVIEARNGEYDLTFRIPMNAKHFNDIHNGGIVRVKASEVSGNQMFRIYKITKPINGIVTVECHHITYDLNKVAVKPFSATGAGNTVSAMVANTIGTYPFTFTTDITNATTQFTMTEPMSFRSALGGYRGSILDLFGGEYRFNNLRVELLATRGSDNGVTIRYGKNLVDLNQEENIDNTYSAVVGYATVDETTRVSDLQTATPMTYPKVKIVDFSSDYETLPTKAQLNTKVQQYIQNNDIGKPNVNLEVSFVALWQTEEYKNIAPLERVSLCDTVTVEFPRLGVSSKAKVVRTEWDVINERYISIELGDARSSFAEAISDNVKEEVEKNTVSWIDEAVNSATDLITGGRGGYVVIGRNANGEPEEILIMDQPTKESAVNVIRMNKNGIGFSTTGYTGPFTSAWTIDGAFVADFITAGTLRSINIEGVNIKGSNLRFGSNPYVQVRTNDAQTGVLFEGTGTVDFKTNGAFSAENYDSNAKKANSMKLLNSSTSSSSEMYNYFNNILRNYIDLEYVTSGGSRSTLFMANYKSTSGLFANRHYMTSNDTDSYNQNLLNNYKWSSDAVANSLSLKATSTRDEISINNYQLGNTNYANYYWAYSQSDQNFMQLSNYKLNSNQLGNSIIESVSATAISIGINNYGLNYNGYANRLSLNSNSATSALAMINYMVGSTTIANMITLTSGTSNGLLISNNSDNGNLKNAVVLSETGSVELQLNNRYGTSNSLANQISMVGNSTNGSQLILTNTQPNSTYLGNRISMISSGSSKPELRLFNYQLNSNTVNGSITISDSLSFRCQNWFDIGFTGSDPQIRVAGRQGYSGTKNGIEFLHGIAVI